MHLTLYTDFALRTLMYLAVVERPATVGEIADSYGISKNHLVKVAHHLGQLGYLDTARGKGGGIALARNPAGINVGRVVRAVEPHFNLVECFHPGSTSCPLTPACALQRVLADANRAFLQVLDRYTLADLVQNRGELAKLLA